jgi:hypothetical protein
MLSAFAFSCYRFKDMKKSNPWRYALNADFLYTFSRVINQTLMQEISQVLGKFEEIIVKSVLRNNANTLLLM